jgi:hypothetical protein
MSRKYDRAFQVNSKVRDILNDPATMRYLTRKLFRPRPRLIPRFLWKGLLIIVLAPAKKTTHQ